MSLSKKHFGDSENPSDEQIDKGGTPVGPGEKEYDVPEEVLQRFSKVYKLDLNPFQTGKNIIQGINKEHLQKLLEHAAFSEVLENKVNSQSREIETLRYIKSLLPIRLRELKSANQLIQFYEEQLSQARDREETIAFLRAQVHVLGQRLREAEYDRERLIERVSDLTEIKEANDFLRERLIKAEQYLESAQNERIELYDKAEEISEQLLENQLYLSEFRQQIEEESFYGRILEGELLRRDRLIAELQAHLQLKEEVIEEQKTEIQSLRVEVRFYKRLLREIRDAFSPLRSLIIKPPRVFDSPFSFDADDISETTDDHTDQRGFIADRDDDSAKPEGQSPSNIVSLLSKLRKVRWEKVSMLVILFFLTTFGTTDLFSHFRPLMNREMPSFLYPLAQLPEILSVPFPQTAIDVSHRKAKSLFARKKVIILDPGHGGSDPGAINQAGWRESDFTLDLALRTEQHLIERGMFVLMTRRTDSSLSLDSRAYLANQYPHTLLVSLHINSHPSFYDTEANGFSVFYNDDQSYPIAKRLFDTVMGIPQLEYYNAGIIDGRRFYPEGKNRLTVLNKLNSPGILLENGFISNEDDFSLLKSMEYRDKLADNIASGIVNSVEFF